jgi:transglutaminase-like putative cysteine protease
MNYTQSTYYFDYDSAPIQKIIKEFEHLSSKQDIIKQLYLKIRDDWRYMPFNIGLAKAHFKASAIAKKPDGHCIDKAILYIACLRAFDIPARLHLAKVSNHIATERLEKIIGTNELAPHGLVDVYHNRKWVKCSPAFNKELCDLYKVDVLDFDGTEDAVLQEYNKSNEKFMTYLEDYGHFEDVPFEFIKETFRLNYPEFYKKFKGQDHISI